MAGISAEWEEAIAAIEARQQKPTYMISGLLAAMTHISKAGCPADSFLPTETLITLQVQRLKQARCESVEAAWQGGVQFRIACETGANGLMRS